MGCDLWGPVRRAADAHMTSTGSSPASPPWRVYWRRGAAVTAGVLIWLMVATGAARAGEVRGVIEFRPAKLGAPPVRNQGFVPRIENPIRPIKSFDPYPHLVVVLEGGPEGAGEPPAAVVPYKLLGESFHVPLLPVVAGARVEIRNRGPRAVVLLAPDDPELLDSVTLKPKSFHEVTIAEPNRVVLVRSQDSVHLEGRIVAFPHGYFSTVDSRGRFAISGVPEGSWTVRVWYRDGWLEGATTQVEVGKRRADVTLTLSPSKLREALQE